MSIATAKEGSITIPLMDLLMALSSVTDLVSTQVANHHRRVMYITAELARELSLDAEQAQCGIIAAALHDIGAFSAREREDILSCDTLHPQRHAEIGYLLFRECAPFTCISELIRYHHVPWANGAGTAVDGEAVPLGSHLVHLADRIDVAIKKSEYVLGQVAAIKEQIQRAAGELFYPEYVEAFLRLAEREYFWLDIQSPAIDAIIRRRVLLPVLELELADAINLSRQLSHLVDYKSPFTSTHTAGVAAVSTALAEHVSLGREEKLYLEMAAYLHDLSKLAIPAEILEKPAGLTPVEYDVIRSHAYHTRRVLEAIPGFETVADWAASHHEHLDGGGYPFHQREMSLGARIIAVADVFTAITENRPYRPGLPQEKVQLILGGMAEQNKLDGFLVSVILESFERFNLLRQQTQNDAEAEYQQLKQLAAA